MAGSKSKVVAFGVTIQPDEGVFNAPGQDDLMLISQPDDGSDVQTADDPTVTGAVWTPAPIYLGRRGRAGATFPLRGPGGSAVPALDEWVPGRILRACGFTEVRNAAPITAAAQAGNVDKSAIVLDASANATDDFYKGYPIAHAGIGTGRIRGTSLIRGYNGSTKKATLMETLGAAIATGNYTIPSGLFYILSTGLSLPILSCSVWRHKVRRDYKDCAISSFALNIPVANDRSTDLPTVEFSMIGLPAGKADQDALTPAQSLFTPVPPARAGKFALAGIKIGHQSLRLEFGLESGAPPNQNFDFGQETYEVLSGTRRMTIDANQTAVSVFDPEALADAQTTIPVLSSWGLGAGNDFIIGSANNLVQPFNPGDRNGFVNMTGDVSPNDPDRCVSICLPYDYA